MSPNLKAASRWNELQKGLGRLASYWLILQLRARGRQAAEGRRLSLPDQLGLMYIIIVYGGHGPTLHFSSLRA